MTSHSHTINLNKVRIVKHKNCTTVRHSNLCTKY